MIVFKKDEQLRIGDIPARFLAQNSQEYLFFLLKDDWETVYDVISIPADRLMQQNIIRTSHNIFLKQKGS
ncbi:hypothetical protein ACLIBH_13810 [Virgibacillus sp. W0430]|uniref:hypothetical protein n=1 Tax=Virgibacillus sp. W0430 TaxID=3391580 RepID=UPI003F462F7F